MKNIKTSCFLGLLAITGSAIAAPQAQSAFANGQHGFYAGVSAALDSGRMFMMDHTPDDYYVPVRGMQGGIQLGYEWLQSPTHSWQWGGAFEAAADVSNAAYKRTNPTSTAVGLRSYDMQDSYSLSLLPMVEHNGQRFFARLGWVTSKIRHNESSGASQTAPTFHDRYHSWIAGLGMGHAINPHWSLQTEWDQTWYSNIHNTNANSKNFTQKLKRSIWRLSLNWHDRTIPMGQASNLPSGWYAGLGVGQDRIAVEQYGTYGDDDHRRAYALDGPAGQLALGYQCLVNPHVVLGAELTGAYTGSKMNYNSGAGTGFSYKHPATIALTFQPGWQFSPGQELFVEAGIGRVHVKKSGDETTSVGIQPNLNRWENAFIGGAGYRSMLNAHNALVMHVQYAHSKVYKQVGTNAFKSRFTGPMLLASWEYHL